MRKYVSALFVCIISVFVFGAFAAQEDMTMEELLPADLSVFIKTDIMSSMSRTFAYFTSLLGSGNIIVKSASEFHSATGINAVDEVSLKQAGIDISKRAGLGLKISDETESVFIMLPVYDPLLFSKNFINGLQKKDKGKRDLYPAVSRYRDFQIGQIEKDIFFFSMSGYFFICSTADIACSVIDSYLNGSASLASDESYLRHIKQKNGLFQTLSLYAAKNAVISAFNFEDKSAQQTDKIGFLSAGLDLKENKLRFKIGMGFNSADAEGMLKVFKADTSAKIPYKKGGSCFFFSLDPKLMLKFNSIPLFSRLYAEAEESLKDRYGISLAHDLLPCFNGIVSYTSDYNAKLNEELPLYKLEEMLYIGLNDSSKADFLKQKTASFLKNKYKAENAEGSFWAGFHVDAVDGYGVKHYVYWNKKGLYSGSSVDIIEELSESPFRKASSDEGWKGIFTAQTWGALCLKDNRLLTEVLEFKEDNPLFCLANAVHSIYLAAGRTDSFLYADGYAVLKK